MRAIRKARGLPGAFVATECLMSYPHLLNIEAGRRRPTPATLDKLALVLGVPIDAISVEIPDCGHITTEDAA